MFKASGLQDIDTLVHNVVRETRLQLEIENSKFLYIMKLPIDVQFKNEVRRSIPFCWKPNWKWLNLPNITNDLIFSNEEMK